MFSSNGSRVQTHVKAEIVIGFNLSPGLMPDSKLMLMTVHICRTCKQGTRFSTMLTAFITVVETNKNALKM